MHGANFFIMMFEVTMNRMVLYRQMVIPVFGLVLIYMLLTFVIYAK